MSLAALPPSPSTTLVVVLGASAWPNSPGFSASEAFTHAAQRFKDYLLDPHGFGLPEANLLYRFNAQTGASDQLEELGSFLEKRMQGLKAANQEVRDVLVYFVGHGSFAGPSADFYLLLRRTNATSLRASGMAIDALAEVLREKTRHTRLYLFLDCCFAAAAFRRFLGGPDQAAITKTRAAFQVRVTSHGYPRKGTVLLCSSDQTTPSLLLPDESCTMFTSVLLDVLRNGDLHRPLQMSLRDIKELAEEKLAALPERNAPRPGLYSPDQSEGDPADIPFFPNPRVEEEQRRQAEDAERAHRAEEQRLRQAEKAQQREVRTITPPTTMHAATESSGRSSQISNPLNNRQNDAAISYEPLVAKPHPSALSSMTPQITTPGKTQEKKQQYRFIMASIVVVVLVTIGIVAIPFFPQNTPGIQNTPSTQNSSNQQNSDFHQMISVGQHIIAVGVGTGFQGGVAYTGTARPGDIVGESDTFHIGDVVVLVANISDKTVPQITDTLVGGQVGSKGQGDVNTGSASPYFYHNWAKVLATGIYTWTLLYQDASEASITFRVV